MVAPRSAEAPLEMKGADTNRNEEPMVQLRASIDARKRMSHESMRRKDPMADVEKLNRVVSTRRYGSVEYLGPPTTER